MGVRGIARDPRPPPAWHLRPLGEFTAWTCQHLLKAAKHTMVRTDDQAGCLHFTPSRIWRAQWRLA